MNGRINLTDARKATWHKHKTLIDRVSQYLKIVTLSINKTLARTFWFNLSNFKQAQSKLKLSRNM